MDERSPNHSDSELSSARTSTEIDLGADLLEHTATIITEPDPTAGFVPERRGPPIASSDEIQTSRAIPKDAVEEALENAKILEREGFSEDAKKILRRILLREPRHISARKRLEEIQNQELKTILDAREAPRVPVRWRREKDLVVEDPAAVLSQLDHDLGLGVLFEEGDAHVFSDPKARDVFRASIRNTIQGKSFTAKSDLGIALLEMGMPELALELFEEACEQCGNETGMRDFGSQVLICETLLQLGRFFDVVSRIEPMISSPELSRKRKTEPYYLLGRAQQALGREEEALRCYRMAADGEPHYRDVDDRIRGILERKLRAK